MTTKKPLLIFPKPTTTVRKTKDNYPPKLKLPTQEQQIQRLGPRWVHLEKAIENQNLALGTSPSGTFSELILVFELAGSIEDFFRAVNSVPDLYFLKEYETEFAADELFAGKDGKPVPGRIFVSMANQKALQNLQRLWKIFNQPDEKQHYDKGLAKFRQLFSQLRDVRTYSVEDRIRDTGFEEYIADLREQGEERVKFEIEFAYPESTPKREKGIKEIRRLLEAHDGRVLETSIVDLRPINYFACIAEAPIAAFDDLTDHTSVKFLKASQVMYFRPVGQVILPDIELEGEPEEYSENQEEKEVFGNPVIALFDGMPMANHAVLEGKLIIDDPDGFGETYEASNRKHGTSMASLILNGDLSDSANSLVRPIYVRPVMKSLGEGEALPDDRLAIDLFHRAVRRMVKGENGEAPTAPSVKIINISIGDFFRPYLLEVSSWAKLLDWLSCEFKVLFIVSAGNSVEDITLPIPPANFDGTDPEVIQRELLKVLVESNYGRKILTPAEGYNVLTVGSLHQDAADVDFSHPIFSQRKNLFAFPGLMSPHSRFGLGHNKSIKPEILMPGGRTLYRKYPIQRDPQKTFFRMDPVGGIYPPGNKVAWPGASGQRNHLVYTCGTSNATALTTNLAGQLYEVLLELKSSDSESQTFELDYIALIIKALLVHGAAWGDGSDLIKEIVKEMPGVPPNGVKNRVSPFLGYGGVNGERVLYCTQARATLIGTGSLCSKDGENAHEFRFPLPAALSGQVIHKKVIATLAWFSPVNVLSQKYRQAHLYMDNLMKNDTMDFEGQSYDHRQSSKGTVQHQILQGESADVLIEQNHLTIKVNCREDASGLEDWKKIPYALAVTLEIPESVGVDIYEEIKERIQERVRPRS